MKVSSALLLLAVTSTVFNLGTLHKLNEPQLLYYEFMTPTLLEKHATFIGNHSVTVKQLTFPRGGSRHDLLLRIPLVSAGKVSRRVPLTVKIVVANDVGIGNSEDSDISYGISDGQLFMGMETTDKLKYKILTPCFKIEGKSGPQLTHVQYGSITPNVPASPYPGRFVITLKPNEHWGSCYLPYGAGLTQQKEYKTRLAPEKGLSLEVYRDHANERYGIKYIAVTVIRDS